MVEKYAATELQIVAGCIVWNRIGDEFFFQVKNYAEEFYLLQLR